MRSLELILRRAGLYVLAFSLLALAVSGCGSRSGKVSGKVIYQGKPLPGGYVNFMSEDAKSLVKTSKIQSDGGYSVSGLPVGSAKITVQGLTARRLAEVPRQGAKVGKARQQKEVLVPPKYSNTEKSRLKYEVKPGSQSHDIELK